MELPTVEVRFENVQVRLPAWRATTAVPGRASVAVLRLLCEKFSAEDMLPLAKSLYSEENGILHFEREPLCV